MSNGYGEQNLGFNISRKQSIDLIVQTCLDNQVTDTRQIAYVLATAEHESDDFRAPEEKWGRKQGLEIRYAGGEEYYGRGNVHLTHESNYTKLGERLGMGRQLVGTPERAAEPEIAAKVLVVGMRDGAFSGAGLGRYINEHATDYVRARAIVNGSDRAERVADLARAWEAQVPALVARVQRDGVQLQPLVPVPCTPRDLKQGDSNQDVFEVQQYLARLDVHDDQGRSLVPDGDFGPRMSQMVQRYQQSIGMTPPNGHIDEALFERLRSDTLQQDQGFKLRNYTDIHGPLADNVLKPGEMGEPVYELRLQLETMGYLERYPVDNKSPQALRTYDARMQEAMRKFQEVESFTSESNGDISGEVRQRLNTRALEAGAAPTTEFDRAENWPPQGPPYTRAEFQPQQVQDRQHANTAPESPESARPPQASVISDPAHPGFPEFQQTLRQVQSMESGLGIASGPHSAQVAAALLVSVEREGGRGGLSQVRMAGNGLVEGVQRLDAFAPERVVGVDPRAATSVSLESHSQQWSAARSPHLASTATPAGRTADQASARLALSPVDQGLFDRIRQDVPAHISDDHIGVAMLAAKRDGLHEADKVGRVGMAGDQLWVVGTTPGFRSATDVTGQVPALADSVQQAQLLNQQRDLALQQDMARVQGQEAPKGPVLA